MTWGSYSQTFFAETRRGKSQEGFGRTHLWGCDGEFTGECFGWRADGG